MLAIFKNNPAIGARMVKMPVGLFIYMDDYK
jgi:hypothetical protein